MTIAKDQIPSSTRDDRSIETHPLIFISHDSRDSQIADAFCRLIEKVSLGILKTFCSSDRTGRRGIEYGTNWFQEILRKLEVSDAVICLLTRKSANRPWLLFEAGVAMGKGNTSVKGLALGITLTEANQGPFAQLHNCSDEPDSITGLVIRLIKDLVPRASPDKDVIANQVKEFIETISPLLEGGKDTEEEQGSEVDQKSFINLSARLLEEIKETANSLPSRIEERLPKEDIQDLVDQLREAVSSADKAKGAAAETLKEDAKVLKDGISSIQDVVEKNLKTIPAIASFLKCGILNIHEDRPSVEDHIIELLQKAKEHIKVVGISLRTLFQGGGKLNRTILGLLSRSSDNKIAKPKWRVMVLDPECEQAKYRSEREEPEGKKIEHGTLFREVRLTIEVVDEWKNRGCNIELRAYKGSPSCFLLIIDNVVFVEQYHYGRAGGARVGELVPLLEFSADSTTYRQLEGHFEYMWDSLSRDPYEPRGESSVESENP